MSPIAVGLIGIGILIVLVFARMWIAFAMALVGFAGFAYLGGFEQALSLIGSRPYFTVANYPLSALPLFVLMGTIVANAGISTDLYAAGNKWFGQLRGGLAMGTVAACAGFAAICGDSIASAVTMGKVSLPEMERHKYSPSLATGCVASGGTLGILIPPSMGFIIYGLLTEESIGLLFMAGILPGLLLAFLFMIAIFIINVVNPQSAPKGVKTSLKEKLASLTNTWSVLALFVLVLGGLYGGIFTPTEAGAVGAFGAIVITATRRRLTPKILFDSILETGQITAMILILIVGAFIFQSFLAITRLPFELAGFIAGLPLPTYAIFAFIIVIYILLGMFLDIIACLVLTIPILFPVIVGMGFDPIWFGVIVVIVMEMGLITPPFGLNVFVLAGVTDVPLSTIFKGALPFVMAMLLCIILITIFPQIALFIPSMM